MSFRVTWYHLPSPRKPQPSPSNNTGRPWLSLPLCFSRTFFKMCLAHVSYHLACYHGTNRERTCSRPRERERRERKGRSKGWVLGRRRLRQAILDSLYDSCSSFFFLRIFFPHVATTVFHRAATQRHISKNRKFENARGLWLEKTAINAIQCMLDSAEVL